MNYSPGLNEVDPVIDAFYAAAISEVTLEEAVRQLRCCFQSASAQIFSMSSDDKHAFPETMVAHNPSTHAALSERIIQENWEGIEVGTDPRMAYSATLPSGYVFHDLQFTTDQEIDRSPFYQEFLGAFDLRYGLGTNLEAQSASSQTLLSINNSETQGFFSEEQMQAFSLIVPHAQRALAMRRRLQNNESLNQSLMALLETNRSGIALLDGTGNVIEMNGELERIIKERDGLNVSRRRIWLDDRSMQNRFDKYVSSPLKRFGIDSVPITDAIIGRPSGKRPYVVNVVPVRVSDPTLVGTAALVLSVVDPAVGTNLSLDLMQQYFHLTLAEAKVAIAIGNGVSAEEIATQNGVTIQTVRSQIKSVFAKTRTHRQNELASLLGRLPHTPSSHHQE